MTYCLLNFNTDKSRFYKSFRESVEEIYQDINVTLFSPEESILMSDENSLVKENEKFRLV